MDDLNLKPAQKAQLQEVADGLLEVYQTLIRMRYLETSWIQLGPHDLTSLLPLYNSLNLTPSIIYLYSILPYVVPPPGIAVDFFQGSEFADFRIAEDVERGRNPLYDSDEDEEGGMKPYMTPLVLMGNHQTVVIYDAKKHVIGMLDQESGGSTDRDLHEGWTIVVEGEAGGDENVEEQEQEGSETSEGTMDFGKEEDSEEDENFDQNEDEEMTENEDEDDGDEEITENEEEDDEDEESDGVQNHYDEMDSRPAPNVLRSMVKWYETLTETPGGGENTGQEWDSKLCSPLYLKHGWPGADFNGDGFLVDQARAKAGWEAKDDSEEPMRQVWKYEGWMTKDWRMQELKDAVVKAEEGRDDEVIWCKRWELWCTELGDKRNERKAKEMAVESEKACPGGVSQKDDELILWEERRLRMDIKRKKDEVETTLKKIREIASGEREAIPHIENTLQYEKRCLNIHEKAHAASMLDAERLCPGREVFVIPTHEEYLVNRVAELNGYAADARVEMEAINEWADKLPEGIEMARKLAMQAIADQEVQVKHSLETVQAITKSLEKA